MDILLRVEEGAFSDIALDAALTRSNLDPRDKRLTTELVYGGLRLRGRLDFALEQFCDRSLQRIETEVLWILRLGTYQLLELERIPDHAAVDSSVVLARAFGHERSTGFINGVLRSLLRGQETIPWPSPQQIRPWLQHVCSLPSWLAKEIMRGLPNDEARALGEVFAAPAPFSLRVNRLKSDVETFTTQLDDAGFEYRHGAFAPEAVIIEKRGEGPIPGDREGHYQVQDEASMLMAHLLDVQEGQQIFDACAAPGGKTTHIAALSDNKSPITAFDKYEQRVEMIKRGAKRLGCPQIRAQQCDLEEPPEFLAEESFDRILLDAPCSGLGVVRRNPESRWNKSRATIKELAALQLQILFNIAPLLRPGGKLLYSVCTFSQQETDDVVSAFLEQQPRFELEDLRQSTPPEWSALFDDKGQLRSYPHRHDGMDAFFAARFIKR